MQDGLEFLSRERGLWPVRRCWGHKQGRANMGHCGRQGCPQKRRRPPTADCAVGLMTNGGGGGGKERHSLRLCVEAPLDEEAGRAQQAVSVAAPEDRRLSLRDWVHRKGCTDLLWTC